MPADLPRSFGAILPTVHITAHSTLIEDRVNGILVPPRHHQALADALTELITHPQLAAHLGEKARRSVEARFDIDRNIAQYLRLFP